MKTNIFGNKKVRILAALLALTCVAPVNAAVTYVFKFDGTVDATVTDPIIGNGTVSFDDNLVPGTYSLSSLTNLAMSFTFGSDTFTLANLATPPANVQVQITPSGSDLSMTFGGSGDGPFDGSIDFMSGTGNLSFEPGFGSLYFTDSGSNFGTFEGIATPAVSVVPEPGSLLGLALLIGAGLNLRRRQQA